MVGLRGSSSEMSLTPALPVTIIFMSIDISQLQVKLYNIMIQTNLTKQQKEIIATLYHNAFTENLYLGYINKTNDEKLENFDDAFSGIFSDDELFKESLITNPDSLPTKYFQIDDCYFKIL